MAINSGQIDLNADAVSLDRENEVVGFNPSESNVCAGFSETQTLTEPINGGVQVQDQMVFQVGDDRGANGPVEPLSGLVAVELDHNSGLDVVANESGKGVFDKGNECVGGASDVEAGVRVVDEGCDVKRGNFSNGLVKNEDEVSVTERSERPQEVYKGRKIDKGLVFELNDGVQNELEHKNASKFAENGSISTEDKMHNESQEVDNLSECKKKDKNAKVAFSVEGDGNGQKCLVEEMANLGVGIMPNSSMAVEDENKIKDADNMASKHWIEDSRASRIAEPTYQLQNDIPDMEVKDINTRESSHNKDPISRNQFCELETLHDSKLPVLEVDGQAEVIQNRTIDINIAEDGPCQNIQNECHGFNLVVDLNPYRHLLEIDMNRKSVSSDLNFCVSDLVWGKVRGHPWWPGQIFDPSAASEKAKRYFKEDTYLIAYFGDQTFAWNDASTIKPFQIHFSQMEKQSNMEIFLHAVDCVLDEVSRRVEFGLSCPCMPEEVFTNLKTQLITNAGIHKRSSRRDGGDRFLNATSFEPMKLVTFVKSLAQSPFSDSDRLDFTISHAQLLAFYRSKGYTQLPDFTVFGGLFESNMEIQLMGEDQYGDQIDGQGLNMGFSHKCNHISGDSVEPCKKQKCLSDLMSENCFCIPNGEYVLESKVGNKLISRSSSEKRKVADNAFDDYSHKSRNRKLIKLQHVPVDEMWSQLCLTATNPIIEDRFLSGMVNFFVKFRKFITPDDFASLEQEISLKQTRASETEARLMEPVASVTHVVEPSNDFHWTDRIESIPEEQLLLENQKEREKFLFETQTERGSPSFKLQASAGIGTTLDCKQQDADGNLGFEPTKLEEHLDESSKDFSPTALILKFSSLDSVPSETNLNKIFCRFGPLIESQTELLKKSSRAKVVFRRRSDAETAFSSAGKYSIFGPSLVSYRLKILPSPSKEATVGARKRERKGKSSGEGTAI